MKVNTGHDAQAEAMGNFAAAETGTSTGVAATTLTKAAAGWTVDAWKGKIVATGSVYGVVLSNTATVLTIDKWYTPSDPAGAAAATPATGVFTILPGAAPLGWMALSESGTAVVAGDTALTGELNQAGGGLNRKLATYSHTAGTNQFAWAATFTAATADLLPKTPAKLGMFNAFTGGRMGFATLIPTPPGMGSAGDQMIPTDTVTI